MATANFHARIERIQKAQAQVASPRIGSIRDPGMAGIAASRSIRRRRRHPILDHLFSTGIGIMLGCLVAVALDGLASQGSLWGPGSAWHGLVYYPTMGGLGLAPLLMLVSLFVAAKRPGFALFSLGYLTGIVVPLAL